VADSFLPFEQAMDELAKRVPGAVHREAILTRLIQRVTAEMNERFDAPLRKYGLNQTTFTALSVLYGSPQYTRKPSELSVFMCSSRTNITRVADELEQCGLVARTPNPEDRRQLNLTLTRKGRELVRKVLPGRRQDLRDLWAPLTGAERQSLELVLRKLLLQLDK
jgi:MarR family transcriptional regulator, negative regulator of the multidrug operon emrRAB